MTEQTQPTNAEISECILAAKVKCVHPDAATTIDVARAVLAKWGTPAGAGEVAEHYRLAIANACEGWTMPDGLRKQLEAALWNPPTPQPTQAQAGAVPLPQYRVLEPRVDIIEAGDEYLQDDAQTWATDPNGTFVGTLYGYALRAARRRIAKKEGADHA